MAEAALFYNMAAQRDAKKRRPSTNTKDLASPQTQSKYPFKKAGSSSRPGSQSASAHSTSQITPEGSIWSRDDQKRSDSISITSSNSNSNSNPAETNSSLSAKKLSSAHHVGSDRMLSTPLPDYKRAANQSNRARAAAASHAANRKSSSVSATSSERNKHVANASAAADSMGTTRADVAGRSSSVSGSTGGSSGLTAITSSDLSASQVSLHNKHPFVERNGRRYLRDPTLPYPLPCDLPEIHRQTLRTMLLVQVFGGPICSPVFAHKPPKRVLDVGCGTGFWSVMCHRHFSKRGYSSISFTGVDIAPLAPVAEMDADMNWRFIQHDLRKSPLQFQDDEFDLIMIKDMSLYSAISGSLQQQELMDEYLRILKPGGTIEFWDGDYAIRMLLPPPSQSTEDNSSHNSNSQDEEHTRAEELGVYALTRQTPLGPPQNQFLADYNGWLTKALEPKRLTAMPCTSIRPVLVQEPDLTDIGDRRFAIPLGEEVRWEKEGVSTGSTSIGAHAPSKGKSKEPGRQQRKHLTASQAALRSTALQTVVQLIDSLEPLLREASGKGQDEWDRWYGSMMNDLLKQNGTSWGECLEVGAWWAQKKKKSSS